MLAVFDVGRLARWLAATAVLLSVVSLGFRLFALRPYVAAALEAGHSTGFLGYPRLLLAVDTDAEANIPTWLTSAILLVAALVMSGISKSVDPADARWRRHWGFLAAVFVLLSLDEVAQLHDITSEVVARLTEIEGVLRFSWVVFAAPLVAALALAYLKFVRALPATTRRLIALSGALYVGGALVIEVLGGWIADDLGGLSTPAYVLCTTVEELLEMLGGTLFLYAVASRSSETHPTPVDGDRPGRAVASSGR